MQDNNNEEGKKKHKHEEVYGFSINADSEEKERRIRRKMENFMAEIADEALEPELLDKIEQLMHGRITQQAKAPYNLSTMRAFVAGFDLGIQSTMHDHHMEIFMGIRKAIRIKEEKVEEKAKEAASAATNPKDKGSSE